MSLWKAVRCTAALIFALSTFALHAGDASTRTLYRTGTIGGSAYGVGVPLVSANVFGDATPELVSCSYGSAFVLARQGSGYAPVWHSAPVDCTGVAVGDRDGNGSVEIYVSTGNGAGLPGTLQVFDPRGYGQARARIEVVTGKPMTSVAVGDVDADGNLEIVGSTATDTYVYDANTLALEWKAAEKGGSRVFIGNVDADPRNEIIVSGGHVLDAKNQQTKWGYFGGFGYSMDVGNLDADPLLEMVWLPGNPNEVLVLHGDTFAMTSFPVTDTTFVAVGDGNGDGQAELICGHYQLDAIRGRRATDGAVLWTIAVNGLFETKGAAVADFDGDGTNEVFWRSGGWLFAGNAQAQALEWQSPDLRPRLMSAIADLDGDGALEHVIAAQASHNEIDETLQVFDFKTRALKGTLKVAGTHWATTALSLQIGQLDADPALEIAVANNLGVWVWDGVTHQQQWTSVGGPIHLSNPILVANVDGDPVDEIIAPTTGQRVIVLDGASATSQWLSNPLEYRAESFAAADMDSDAQYDLIVGNIYGFYVFEMPNTAWRTYVTVSDDVYAVAATSAGGGQFAVIRAATFGYAPMKVTTYSGTTLAQLWSCTVQAGASDTSSAMYGRVGNETRLLVGQNYKGIAMYPIGGNACPTPDMVKHPADLSGMQLLDVDGDGRRELAITGWASFELSAIGPSSEPRGDVNLDGVVSDVDIDALARYLLFGTPAVPPPGADVDADGRIAGEDLFYLINYRRGTGEAPPS